MHMALPKLIVFDLDACLWDTEMKFLSDTPWLAADNVMYGTHSFAGQFGEVRVKDHIKPIKL